MKLSGAYILGTLVELGERKRGQFRDLQKKIGKYGEAIEIADAKVGRPFTGQGSDVNSQVRREANIVLENRVRAFLGSEFEEVFGPKADFQRGGLENDAEHLVYYARVHEIPRMSASSKLERSWDAFHSTHLAISQLREIVGRELVDSAGRKQFHDFTGVELPRKLKSKHYEEIGDWAISYVCQLVQTRAAGRRLTDQEIPNPLRKVFGKQSKMLDIDGRMLVSVVSDLEREGLASYGSPQRDGAGLLNLPGYSANTKRLRDIAHAEIRMTPSP